MRWRAGEGCGPPHLGVAEGLNGRQGELCSLAAGVVPAHRGGAVHRPAAPSSGSRVPGAHHLAAPQRLVRATAGRGRPRVRAADARGRRGRRGGGAQVGGATCCQQGSMPCAHRPACALGVCCFRKHSMHHGTGMLAGSVARPTPPACAPLVRHAGGRTASPSPPPAPPWRTTMCCWACPTARCASTSAAQAAPCWPSLRTSAAASRRRSQAPTASCEWRARRAGRQALCSGALALQHAV